MGCGTSSLQNVKSRTPPQRARSPSGDSNDSETDKLYAFKDILRKRALPMIEARSSCENLDMLMLQPSDFSNKENFAALRIQKQLRRKLAKVDAEREQKWMIFSNLDAFDEAEMVKLAQFMEIAMERVGQSESNRLTSTSPPGSPSASSISSPLPISRISSFRQAKQSNSLAMLAGDEHQSKLLLPDSPLREGSNVEPSMDTSPPPPPDRELPIMADRSLSHEKLKTMDMSQITIAPSYNKKHSLGAGEEYDLPPAAPITAEIAKCIIDVYKHHGRLSTKAVTKLLRLTYRKMQTLPNTTVITVGRDDRLTIVGDIHGQLPDLMHILDEVGLPSSVNKYIFNGDFVDRGPCGVEVMCVLMSLFLAFPDSVALNRGNHEDFAICCVYGFQKECCDKYDYDTFGMFSEMFQHLPLFCLVNDKVFVLHGGLFHNDDVLLSELNEIHRTDFSLKDLPEGGEALGGVARSQRREFFKQVQRDALWSDPMAQNGFALSSRGAGVNFGPDIAKRFLTLNNLTMVVRSHEVCRTGFELPFSGTGTPEDQQMVCTIFSASNYSGGGNSAAYMTFTRSDGAHSREPNTVRVQGCELQYRVHYFHIDLDEELTYSQGIAAEISNNLSLEDLIFKKREYLLEAFQLADPQNTGLVTRLGWTDVMQRVLQLQIRWLTLIPELVDSSCFVEHGDQVLIDYHKFILEFRANINIQDGDDESGSSVAANNRKEKSSSLVVDSLYSHHKELFAVFNFFDKDKDGHISREDFKAGCEILQKMDNGRPSGTGSDLVKECEVILDIMDINGRGLVDINEFFEMFRVSDTLKNRRSVSVSTTRLRRNSSLLSFAQKERKMSDAVEIDGISIISDPVPKMGPYAGTDSDTLNSPQVDI